MSTPKKNKSKKKEIEKKEEQQQPTVRRTSRALAPDPSYSRPDFVPQDFEHTDFEPVTMRDFVPQDFEAADFEIYNPYVETGGFTTSGFLESGYVLETEEVINLKKIADLDTVGITETTHAFLNKIRAADVDTVGIAETTAKSLAITRAADKDTVGIPETTSRIRDMIRVADLDTVGITETPPTKATGIVKVADPDTVGIVETTHARVEQFTGVHPSLFEGPSGGTHRPYVKYTTPKKKKLSKEVEKALKPPVEKGTKETLTTPITVSKRIRSLYNIEGAQAYEQNQAFKKLVDKATSKSLELLQASPVAPVPPAPPQSRQIRKNNVTKREPEKKTTEKTYDIKPVEIPLAERQSVIEEKVNEVPNIKQSKAISPRPLTEVLEDQKPLSAIPKPVTYKTVSKRLRSKYNTLRQEEAKIIRKEEEEEDRSLEPKAVQAEYKNARLVRQITQMKDMLSLLLALDAI